MKAYGDGGCQGEREHRSPLTLMTAVGREL